MNANSASPAIESEALLPRVAAGDRDAVQRCIARYGALLWAIARRMTRTPADAEDAIQDVFVEIWRAAARFDAARGSEQAFIVTIARRRLIDRARSERARRASEQPAESAELEGIAAEQPPADVGPDAERASRALATLPREQQRVIMLAVIEGFSHAEIAARVGLPLGTVKTYVRRGLIRIRELLGESARGSIQAGLRP